MAIDMVIVIENSYRMQRKGQSGHTGLDTEGLRFDAAAALISMCDVEYSRATYFLFADDLYVYDGTIGRNGNTRSASADEFSLSDISFTKKQENLRKSIMSDLTGKDIRTGYGTRNGSNLGAALEAAVDVQLQSKDNGNRKVILLLTGGSGKQSQESEDRARAARKTAEENGIEIYAVALKDNASTALLEELVSKSENFQFANRPEDIVRVYRNIYATMIGSKVEDAESEKIEDKQYQINLPIPNKSVSEVNIVLDIKGVSDLVLRDPNGNEITQSDDNTLINRSNNFEFIKLISPEDKTYKLVFTAKEEKKYSIQYVFSYGVDVQTDVTAAEMDADKREISKHEPVTITAQYTENGFPKDNDTRLYEIPATVTLRKGDRIIARDTTMEHDDKEYHLTFTDLEKEGAGEYTAAIHIEGDGMMRDSEVTFKLRNDRPELISRSVNGKEYSAVINIPNDSDSYLPGTHQQSYNLYDYVKDVNPGDRDTLKGIIIEKTADVDCDLEGMTLTITPRKNTAAEGEIRVVIEDKDQGRSPELVFPVKVENYEERYRSYTARFDDVGVLRKNDICRLTLKMYPENSSIAIQQDDMVPAVIKATVTANGVPLPEAVDLKKDSDGCSWSGEFPTGEKEAEYTVTASFMVGQIQIDAEPFNPSSKNRAPELKPGKSADNTWSVEINDPLKQETYEVQKYPIQLTDLVSDPENDEITFEIDQDKSKALVDASINSEKTLTITSRLNRPTEGDVVVTCEDNDHLAGPTLCFHISIISVEEKYNQYSAELSADGHGKNRDITVTLTVKDENGLLVTGDENLPKDVKASYLVDDTPYPLNLTRGEDGKWTAILHTAETEKVYTVSAEVVISRNVKITATDYNLSTKNNPPYIVKELSASEKIPEVINIEPFLFWNNETGDITISELNDYFHDDDPGDTLTFTVNKQGLSDYAEAVVNGNTLTISGLKEAPESISFTVTATDAENAEVESGAVSFTVKSLKKQGTVILIIIAAAAVVLLIMRQIIKPAFQDQSFEVLTKKQGMDPITQGMSKNMKGKKPLKLGDFTTARASAVCGNEIPTSALNKIGLYPAYGSRIKVKTEDMGSLTVKIGSTKLTPGKKFTLALNGTLSVDNNGNDDKKTELQFVMKKPGPTAAPTAAPNAAQPSSAPKTGGTSTARRTSRT